MTEAIIIELQGKVDDLTKKLNLVEKELKQTSDAAKKASSTAKMGWTEFRSAYSTVLDVVRVGQQVWQATGQEFVNYAEQVKNLSRSLGASAEETSRLIQVADDVRLSYDSLKIAMKEAQKDGIQPNIEGLATLSDQYNALQSPVEKTKFLLEKFGKSGLEMGKLMEKGGDGIRKMSASLNDNLIMTEEGIKKSDEYQRSLDDFNDSVYALQLSLGDVLPFFSDLLKMGTANIEMFTTLGDVLEGKVNLNDWAAGIINNYNVMEDAADDLGDAHGDMAEMYGRAARGGDDLNDVLETEEERLKRVTKEFEELQDAISKANQESLGFMENYADSQKDYEKEHGDAVDGILEAQQKLSDGIKKYGADSDEVGDLSQELQNAKNDMSELEASWHESTQRMIYDMVMTKLAVDGLTDAEYEAGLQIAVNMGIMTEAQQAQAQAAMDMANAIVAGVEQSEEVVRESARIKAEAEAQGIETTNEAVEQGTDVVLDAEAEKLLAKNLAGVESAEQAAITQEQLRFEAELMHILTGTTWDEIEAQRLLRDAVLDTANAYSQIPTGTGTPPPDANYHSQDKGGMGVAGVPYMIGTGAQPEIFVPQTAGTFIPNADKKGFGGAVYNIVINNPKGESSDNSIRKALKNVSYIGLAA